LSVIHSSTALSRLHIQLLRFDSHVESALIFAAVLSPALDAPISTMSTPPSQPLVAQPSSASPGGSHEPTSAYTHSIPAPPRILVPPPAWAPNALALLTLQNPHSPVSDEVRNTEFLSRVTSGDFSAPKSPLEWRYEWRRRAQRVLPFIHLGPIGATKDRDFLKHEGITLLLAVRDTRSAQAKLLDGKKVAAELGIASLAVDVDGNQELIAAFPHAVRLINDHLSEVYTQHCQAQALPTVANGHLITDCGHTRTGKVLVFCESGNERSAAVVAAYVMTMYGLDLIRAIQVVQSQRFCAAFDDDMKNLLFSYMTILMAQRDVAQSAGIPVWAVGPESDNKASHAMGQRFSRGVSRAAKRSVDKAYDTEMECGDVEGQIDRDRFDKREGYAPFQDRIP
jgi:serine/threonine/tyrosine-interacting protein